jgi:acylphosphatase
MRLARRYLVTGRVHGVGFRFFAQAAAVREGLCGWVRNLPGGHVEALAEGEGDALERFEVQLRQGPAAARVDRVIVKDEAPAGPGSHFEIR